MSHLCDAGTNRGASGFQRLQGWNSRGLRRSRSVLRCNTGARRGYTSSLGVSCTPSSIRVSSSTRRSLGRPWRWSGEGGYVFRPVNWREPEASHGCNPFSFSFLGRPVKYSLLDGGRRGVSTSSRGGTRTRATSTAGSIVRGSAAVLFLFPRGSRASSTPRCLLPLRPSKAFG